MQQRQEPVTRPRHATRAKHSRPASALVSAAAQWLHLTYLVHRAGCFVTIANQGRASPLPHCALSSCSSVQTNCRCLRCCVGCENVGKVAMTMVSNEIGRTLPWLGPNSAQLPACSWMCLHLHHFSSPPNCCSFVSCILFCLPFQQSGNWLRATGWLTAWAAWLVTRRCYDKWLHRVAIPSHKAN